MARRQQRRLWTSEDDKLILESDKPVKELAEELGRTPRSLYQRMYRIQGKIYPNKDSYHRTAGYARNSKHFRRWEQEESKIILESDKTDEELHHILGRSIAAIHKRRYNLLNELVPTAGII